MRPETDDTSDPKQFLMYYRLKEELAAFCRKNGIPSGGSKEDLVDRIRHFLETGASSGHTVGRGRKKPADPAAPALDAAIPGGYRNDQVHRKFFTDVIGPHFRFNVRLMEWMKNNAGRRYRDAVEEWLRIHDEMKTGKKNDIPKQFEYNRYTRDFFRANPGMTRAQAVKCWNHRKSLPGKPVYSDSDLSALDK